MSDLQAFRTTLPNLNGGMLKVALEDLILVMASCDDPITREEMCRLILMHLPRLIKMEIQP